MATNISALIQKASRPKPHEAARALEFDESIEAINLLLKRDALLRSLSNTQFETFVRNALHPSLVIARLAYDLFRGAWTHDLRGGHPRRDDVVDLKTKDRIYNYYVYSKATDLRKGLSNEKQISDASSIIISYPDAPNVFEGINPVDTAAIVISMDSVTLSRTASLRQLEVKGHRLPEMFRLSGDAWGPKILHVEDGNRRRTKPLSLLPDPTHITHWAFNIIEASGFKTDGLHQSERTREPVYRVSPDLWNPPAWQGRDDRERLSSTQCDVIRDALHNLGQQIVQGVRPGDPKLRDQILKRGQDLRETFAR